MVVGNWDLVLSFNLGFQLWMQGIGIREILGAKHHLESRFRNQNVKGHWELRFKNWSVKHQCESRFDN